MILEAVLLQVISGKQADFERDFAAAGKIIRASPGYIEHSLSKCIEHDNKYLLLVQWETLEDHTVGFRQSAAYQDWKQLLHKYYDPFPTVEHFARLI